MNVRRPSSGISSRATGLDPDGTPSAPTADCPPDPRPAGMASRFATVKPVSQRRNAGMPTRVAAQRCLFLDPGEATGTQNMYVKPVRRWGGISYPPTGSPHHNPPKRSDAQDPISLRPFSHSPSRLLAASSRVTTRWRMDQ
ncbi:hypothetical protein CH63R_00967 [Colletotrichum higginsianum IMI 349063]|uniref:Uncharacterized protein n=1 Tax=Colletotrichum higginsianum (strain IMI 349063) TaxID=759273 RepID=A0A1B7YUS3_COLHI|nr:hypothetical protein CH63R_00967 [Colletotrichum higginsianum IMI 349063]OBR15787.1 hypothetical protein CH63R_00967 [Colletotrichum higginsianum IMI 349063]